MKKLKLCVTGLCEGDLLVAGGFTSQKASNAENVFVWWRRHALELIGFMMFKWHSDTDIYSQRRTCQLNEGQVLDAN